ncbi:MAG: histidine phosphatase family protein [Desulfuromonas sp.]|nr:histidine phosphatase family protein [Desulfuromonas sp.]
MPKKLTLIRHAAIDNAFDHCYIGRSDLPLSAAGRQQALSLAQRIQQTNSDIDTMWSSPAARAHQTARPIAQQLGLEYTEHQELQEVDFGRWDGLTFDQICALDPQLIDDWAKLDESFCFPNGESQRHFTQRITQLVTSIHSSTSEHLAIVSHGGVIRALICQLVGWPASDAMKFNLVRGGYATLDFYANYGVLTGLYNEI